MKCCRFASWVLGLSIAVALLLFAALPQRQGAGHEDDAKETEPRPAIELPERPIELMIELGREDEEQVRWIGELKLSEGSVLEVDLVQASADSKVEGATFNVRTARRNGARPAQNERQNRRARQAARQQNRAARQQARQKQQQAATDQPSKKDAAGTDKGKPNQPGKTEKEPAPPQFHLVPVRMRVTLDAPVSATMTVSTNRGAFEFKLEDVTSGDEEEYLDGQASVSGELAATRLTGSKTEDDFPAMAKTPDGSIWLVYVEYTPGPPLVFERIVEGNFDLLEPHGHGDRIRLMQYDGQAWHAPIDVTESGLDVWRPAIAVDGRGDVCLAWAQSVDGNWDIYTRRFTPPGRGMPRGKLSATERVTDAPDTDYNVQLVSDPVGQVWATWQAWR
ncbi:MAG TPA: hypothetical protein VFI31_27335, partial [Pirellulales bacterium]|nr:hypothetical protein [Pirellulales bacterium]